MASDSKTKAVLEIGASLDKSGISRAFGKLRAEQDKLTNSIAATKLEQKQLNVQMRGLKRGSPELVRMKEKYASLGQQIKQDELAVIGLQRQQLKLRKSAPDGSRWEGAGKRIKGALGTIGRGAAIMGTAVVGAAVVGAHKLMDFAESMDKTAKTSRALGLTSNALQELRYAAERGGMGTEQFDVAMQRMVRRVGEGSSEAKKAFKSLGLRMDWMQRQAPDVQLEAVADRLREIKDPGKRLSTLMALFDSEGAKGMATMLEGGREGLHALRVEARELGLIIGGDNLKAAEDFNDQMLTLKTKAAAALAPLAAQLMPQLVEKFGELVTWIQNNQDRIMAFTDVATTRIGTVVDAVSKVVGVAWTLGSALSDLVGGWENLTAVGVAFWLAMKLGMLSNPITAAILLASTALLALVTHFDKVKMAAAWTWNNGLRPFFQSTIDGVNAILAVVNKLSGTDLRIGDLPTWDLPKTQAAGTAAPAAAAGSLMSGPSNVVNNYSIAASLDEGETRRVLAKAQRETQQREDAGAMFSAMPEGV